MQGSRRHERIGSAVHSLSSRAAWRAAYNHHRTAQAASESPTAAASALGERGVNDGFPTYQVGEKAQQAPCVDPRHLVGAIPSGVGFVTVGLPNG